MKIPPLVLEGHHCTERGELKARAVLLTQNLDQLEALELDELRVFEVTLYEIEAPIRVLFLAALHKADTLQVREAAPDRAPWTTSPTSSGPDAYVKPRPRPAADAMGWRT
ncbi:hypothetical protein TUSST3_30060 [Streptomyces sp. TUS-ST3]|uniref:hypothetical protein n=1 Tax=Streptomyces sp. TUS-ST3 TaxID=3025591 RepID=UPI00235B5AAC|nr:hypothetical protein [Streptomyces sp. TUS-ST3]GLP66386.1 hypothetical protein TUSST3_30060 [Streptomyces sp. TUS-ST3]